MKIPCFHKYFSVNFFIYLILITALFYCKACIRAQEFVFYPCDTVINYFVAYQFPQIATINGLAILTEYILNKFGVIQKHCNVIKSKPIRIIIYIITIILFLVFIIYASLIYLFIFFASKPDFFDD